jgi:hypothetical protein
LIIPGNGSKYNCNSVGYGRAKELGKMQRVRGRNVYNLSSSHEQTRDYYSPSVEVKDAGKEYRVAKSQVA